MKVVLFCGGYGTRMQEYSDTIPKPLVPIGYRPIIWHLMKYYAHFGHKEFILCLGYRGDLIKEYFLNYNECMSNDFVLEEGGDKVTLLHSDIEDWKITFCDTGLASNIGQRLLRVQHLLDDDEMFLANYSDGLSDIDLVKQLRIFRQSEAYACFSCVRPSYSLSTVKVDQNGAVKSIQYMSKSDVWINGGFMILRSEIFDKIEEGDELVEKPFQRLIEEGRLLGYRHEKFWSAMDTFKDKKTFDDMYASGNTPWQLWRSE
jgi:glucose-1-phosphate cytidylyltransferase